METGHDPRRAPSGKERAQAAGGQSPTGRHLPDGFGRDRLVPVLSEEPRDVSVGESGHGGRGGGSDRGVPPGSPSKPASGHPHTPLSTAGPALPSLLPSLAPSEVN